MLGQMAGKGQERWLAPIRVFPRVPGSDPLLACPGARRQSAQAAALPESAAIRALTEACSPKQSALPAPTPAGRRDALAPSPEPHPGQARQAMSPAHPVQAQVPRRPAVSGRAGQPQAATVAWVMAQAAHLPAASPAVQALAVDLGAHQTGEPAG